MASVTLHVCVWALKEKWLELSTHNSVQFSSVWTLLNQVLRGCSLAGRGEFLGPHQNWFLEMECELKRSGRWSHIYRRYSPWQLLAILKRSKVSVGCIAGIGMQIGLIAYVSSFNVFYMCKWLWALCSVPHGFGEIHLWLSMWICPTVQCSQPHI